MTPQHVILDTSCECVCVCIQVHVYVSEYMRVCVMFKAHGHLLV